MQILAHLIGRLKKSRNRKSENGHFCDSRTNEIKAYEPYLFDTATGFLRSHLLRLTQHDPSGSALEPSPAVLHLDDRENTSRTFSICFAIAGPGTFPNFHLLRHSGEIKKTIIQSFYGSILENISLFNIPNL